MFKGDAYYFGLNYFITSYQFRAWTRRGAIKKSFKYLNFIEDYKGERIHWVQVWLGRKRVL